MTQQDPTPAKRLSDAAAVELFEQSIAGMSAELPLTDVLIAVADDTEDRQLRRAARGLADRVSQGADLAAAAESAGPVLPERFRQVLMASANVKQAASLLAAVADHESARRQLQRRLWSVIAYPSFVAALLLALLLFVSVAIAPTFRDIYEEMEFELPASTVAMMSALDLLPWFLAVIAIGVCGWLLLGFAPRGIRVVDWLRSAAPLFGRLWIDTGHHELSSLLGALTEKGVPLPQALRCTESSLRDRNLARALQLAADRALAGETLGQSMQQSIHFEPTLTALVRWGEVASELPAALRQAQRHYAAEIDLRADFLMRVLPPIMLCCVAFVMFMVLAAFLIPCVTLLNAWSIW